MDCARDWLGFPGKLLCLDEVNARVGEQSDENLNCDASPDNPAYVMYTSGSTGQPKGMALAHRGVVNLLSDFQRRKPIQPGDSCSWWTSPSFDVSVYEILSPLIAGGILKVIPERIRLEASRLSEWFKAQSIYSAYLPPFLLSDFVSWLENHPESLLLSRLLVGVEPISESLLIRLLALLPGLSVINGYGPTETTICSTLYELEANHTHPGNAPIGKPAANTQVYLLDRELRLVPPGAVGEIFIGGVGLTGGYLNQPELTAQRFVPSPFKAREHLYRTGDLARLLPDGNLVFIGRMDNQVKLNGVRIELGEIEAALVQHPSVKQAVALLEDRPTGGKSLVAYIVPNQTQPPFQSELRQFLAQRLPSPMVPTIFYIVDVLPQTPNGKVDRKALPFQGNQISSQDQGHQLPQTNEECLLAAIWQEILGVETVGLEDNFFELGGDSIMSLQIVSRAAEAGLHLTPQQVFQAPTLSGLAALAWIGDDIQESAAAVEPGIEIPLTPIQHWFFEQDFPNPNHWNQSQMFITAEPLDPECLSQAVAALVKKQGALRMRYQHQNGNWRQVLVSPDEVTAFELVDLSDLDKSQQNKEIEQRASQAQHSLDLSTGALFRVVYFHLGTDLQGRLLVTIHHLAVDGVSWRIFVEDLEKFYRLREANLPIENRKTVASFQEWAQKLVDYANSLELKRQMDFWLQMNPVRYDQLPRDKIAINHPVGTINTEGNTQSYSISFNCEETQSLLKISSGVSEVTVQDVLVTALTRAYQRWTEKNALWIDLESHGREAIFEDVDHSRAVGWFTALYPVLLSLQLDAAPGVALQCVKKQLRRIPNHGLGYGLLRYLYRDADLRSQLASIPAPEISFNYLGQIPDKFFSDFISGIAPESCGRQRDPDARRSHLINIEAIILQGRL